MRFLVVLLTLIFASCTQTSRPHKGSTRTPDTGADAIEGSDRAKARLGARADQVGWIVADVTEVADVGRFDVWHDRAAFHFLTRRYDRQRYAGLLKRTVPPGGHAVIATFALDGPAQCSGLDVVRYDGKSLARELADDFELLRGVPEAHVTPWGKPQSFQYSVFRHRPAGASVEVEA